jgi:hypothetical protein
VTVSGVGFNPALVVAAALAEHFFAHHRDAQNLADEIHDLLGPGQATEVAMDDDAVETFVNKSQQLVE